MLHPVTKCSRMLLCLPSNEMMSRFVFLQLTCEGSAEMFDFLNAHLALSFPLFHPLTSSSSSVFLSSCFSSVFPFLSTLCSLFFHLLPDDLHLLQTHLLAPSLWKNSRGAAGRPSPVVTTATCFFTPFCPKGSRTQVSGVCSSLVKTPCCSHMPMLLLDQGGAGR